MDPIQTPEGLSLFHSDDHVVMERASFDGTLSSIGFDETRQLFWATTDHLQQRTLFEAVSTILTTQGYVDNLENVLAGFDRVQIGMIAKVKGQPSDGVIRRYNQCLLIGMPDKQKVGPILKRFYDQISSYEAEVARLNEAKAGKKPDRETSAKLRKAERLEEKCAGLEQKVTELSAELSQLRKNHAQATRAMQSGQMLPEHIKLGTIRGIDLHHRTVHIKSGRMNLTYRLDRLQQVPELNSRCLVYVLDGQIRDLIVYQFAARRIELRAAVVLETDGEIMKLRDTHRKEWLVPVGHEEGGRLSLLKRKSKVVLRVLEDHIIGVQPLGTLPPDYFSGRVSEAITKHQIGLVHLEALTLHDDQDFGEDVA